jgi:hypothetical protein
VLICHCSLAGTAACNSCPEFIREYGTYYPPITIPFWPSIYPTADYPYSPKEPEKKVHRTIKTLEYDDKGRVIKEIIEEE